MPRTSREECASALRGVQDTAVARELAAFLWTIAREVPITA